MLPKSNGAYRFRRSGRAALLAGSSLAIISAGVASASSGGMDGGNGGASAPGKPKIKEVVCLQGCVGVTEPVPGGVVQVSGRKMSMANKVLFKGGASARARAKGPTVVEARVPKGARSGKVRVADDYGNRSRKSKNKLSMKPASALKEHSGPLEIKIAEASPRKFFYAGKEPARLRYIARASGPVNLRIDAVKAADGAVVRSWFESSVAPNSLQEVVWNGDTSTGRVAPMGDYKFVVRPNSTKASASQSVSTGDSTVSFYDHIFPVRGKHSYGDGLGAGRGHKGQDVFAKCGKRMVAARAGRVEAKGYQGAAGNYVVIDGKGNNHSYVYMHLLKPASVRNGQQVRTGQRIGRVGETGNAVGCHLHFELWAGDWYDGGHVVNPTAPLKRWDAYS